LIPQGESQPFASIVNGIIYCRVSTKEQAEGTSLESQRQACLEYATKNAIRILKIFIEEGESAKFADRTELLILLEVFGQKPHRVQALIVWKVDRFARNVVDHFQVKTLLVKHGVTIHSVTEPIDAKPDGRLMETILAGFAQFDNDIRALRCKEGMRRKIEEGLYPWRPPLGYRSASSIKAKKTQPDIPDPERFPIIQEGWRRLLTGTYRKTDLLRFFLNQGLTTRAGRPIQPQLIDWIFNNKYYAGVLTEPWSRTEYPGRHEPMITPEEFALAQQILNPRRNNTPHLRANPDFPLRSLLRCPSCGGYLTASWSRGRGGRYAYYWCRRRPCARYGKGFARDHLHGYFEQLLTAVVPKSNRLPDLEARTLAVLTQLRANETARSELTRQRLRSLEQENQRLIAMRRRELIDDHEFLRNHGRLSVQIQTITAGLATAARTVDADQIREALAFLADLPSFWPELDLDLQTRFNRVLFPEGLTVGDGRTPKLGPLFSFIEASGSVSSCEVHPTDNFLNRLIDEFVRLFELIRIAKERLTRSDPAVQPEGG
jgi:DNA invertase Pin-like site-specific DNA recombinase